AAAILRKLAMSWERFNFTDDFQESIIACLLAHPDEFDGYGHCIKAEYFNSIATTLLVEALEDYKEEYQKWPNNFTILANYARATNLRRNPQAADELIELCKRLAEIDTTDWVAVRDRCLIFARERAVLNTLKKIHYHVTEGTLGKHDPVRLMEQ